jgi:hypothetical protein
VDLYAGHALASNGQVHGALLEVAKEG